MNQPVRPALRAASHLIASLALLFAASGASASDRTDAVDCEAIVQATYWDLRHEGKGEAFPFTAYRDVLATRAERTARLVSYLRAQRGRDLSHADLQGEIDRLGRNTQAPEALAKLFKALGNDPQLIGECLAKPLLVDRLARQHFALDPAVHAVTKHRALAAYAAARASGTTSSGESLVALPLIPAGLAQRVANPAKSGPEHNALHALREFNVVEWQVAPKSTATRWSKIVETDADFRALRGEYLDGKLQLRVLTWPKQRFDAWWAQAASKHAPDYADRPAQALVLPQLASGQVAGWTRMRDENSFRVGATDAGTVIVSSGSEVLQWGGLLVSGASGAGPAYAKGGLAYNPTTDAWRELALANAPTMECGEARGLWTGTKMLVVVGRCTVAASGNVASHVQPAQAALYNPVANTWQALAAPPSSWQPSGGYSAVWTGTRAIYFGGFNDGNALPIRTGAILDPATGAWTAYTINSIQVGTFTSERRGHQAFWTGSTMVVVGGNDTTSTCESQVSGFAINPLTAGAVGSPVPTRPSGARAPLGRGFWNGTVVVFYAPTTDDFCAGLAGQRGAMKYNPATKAWTLLNPAGDPQKYGEVQLVGTTRLVVWGGTGADFGTLTSLGATYRIDTDTWTTTSNTGVPRARKKHLGAVVGNELVWLGGYCQQDF
ncbi:MAG: hypothetical protein ACREO3_02820, partial [Arenimonas sp.]